MENVVNEYFEDISGFKSEYIVHKVLKKSGEIANFKPFEVNPVEYCSNINCPILMAHGDNDQKIPISFGSENFENIKSTNKQFIVVPGAGHFDLHKIGGENYLNQVFEFIKQNSKNNKKFD
ncbi:MAG: alpha/beta hydrolase [Saprospiraceae bacterium]|nr:alpha/beta hydrolase [Saprospiraceae bacterium]